MGMGADVFTLGQKYMVFTTDERYHVKAGEFQLFDVWTMDQFARYLQLCVCVLTTLGSAFDFKYCLVPNAEARRL